MCLYPSLMAGALPGKCMAHCLLPPFSKLLAAVCETLMYVHVARGAQVDCYGGKTAR